MHSKIFQITETRVDRDNYLNEDTLEQGDGHYYDYCSEIDEEERKFHIANLIEKALPKGMFTLVAENTIRYNGGADKWKKEFVTAIQEKAQAVTVENCMMWIGAVYQLEKFLKNHLTSIISSIWTSMALMAMPNNRTRFYRRSASLSRENYFTSVELLTIISKHYEDKTNDKGTRTAVQYQPISQFPPHRQYQRNETDVLRKPSTFGKVRSVHIQCFK